MIEYYLQCILHTDLKNGIFKWENKSQNEVELLSNVGIEIDFVLDSE